MAERDGPNPQVNTRVSPVLFERVSSAAAVRFQGNQGMLVREALELYLDLRDRHGFDFDRVMHELRSDAPVALAS